MRINGTAADDSSPLVFRAFAAHHRACARQRAVHEVPSAGSFWCELGGLEYVVLCSDAGRVLRVYRVRYNGVLRELRRWPSELDEAPRREAAGVASSPAL